MGGGGGGKPDNSAQIRAANEQTAQLKKQQEELQAQNEQLAMKNTDSLKGIRRRQGGRAQLITTSESGLKENNNLGT